MGLRLFLPMKEGHQLQSGMKADAWLGDYV
jgi:hypothetical protein